MIGARLAFTAEFRREDLVFFEAIQIRLPDQTRRAMAPAKREIVGGFLPSRQAVSRDPATSDDI